MRMYEVGVKCGHVGRNNYVEKTFAIKANSGKEAAAIARQMPRVKHHHADAIRFVSEIDTETFNQIIAQNNDDPYFHCDSIQEQRRKCELDIKQEYAEDIGERTYWYDLPPVFHGKTRVRNPKKYFNRMISAERLVYEAA